jgi:CYTH domain-containing protein
MSLEREWRFVVKRGPKLPRGSGRRIEQGYLHADAALSIRVRITAGRAAALTIKSGTDGGRGGPLSREEFEYAVPLADARRLMRAAPFRVVKRRHVLGRIELDVFEGALRGLVVAEVEVRGGSRRAPEPPSGWEWRDVSHDARYSNANLARDGMPRGAPRARLG